jgi:uncharacterized protein HemX
VTYTEDIESIEPNGPDHLHETKMRTILVLCLSALLGALCVGSIITGVSQVEQDKAIRRNEGQIKEQQASQAAQNVLIASKQATIELVGRDLHAESVQRVTTIGERCEGELLSAEEHEPKERQWLTAHRRCLVSLAKVEARAHVRYEPPKGSP